MIVSYNLTNAIIGFIIGVIVGNDKMNWFIGAYTCYILYLYYIGSTVNECISYAFFYISGTMFHNQLNDLFSYNNTTCKNTIKLDIPKNPTSKEKAVIKKSVNWMTDVIINNCN